LTRSGAPMWLCIGRKKPAGTEWWPRSGPHQSGWLAWAVHGDPIDMQNGRRKM
jgi:hypothetical protein